MANRYFLILDNGEGATVSLDAVQRLSETFSGQVTKNPIADGNSVADHYITNNATFNLDGVISGVVTNPVEGLRFSPDITEEHRNLIRRGAIVALVSGDTSYLNCYVNSVSFSKTSKEGVLGWKVKLKLEQIQLAQGGQTSIVNIIPDQSASRTDISSSSTRQNNGVQQIQGAVTNVIPDSTIFEYRLPEGG